MFARKKHLNIEWKFLVFWWKLSLQTSNYVKLDKKLEGLNIIGVKTSDWNKEKRNKRKYETSPNAVFLVDAITFSRKLLLKLWKISYETHPIQFLMGRSLSSTIVYPLELDDYSAFIFCFIVVLCVPYFTLKYSFRAVLKCVYITTKYRQTF